MQGKSLLISYLNLPRPAKAVLLVGAGGSLVAALYMLLSPQYMVIVVIGLAVAGLAFLAFRKLLKWGDKRKAKPFEQKLAENASAAPQGASDAGAKARMDDLRRKFEEGVSRFRDHGKDLYSLPWYLLVGEPGSGKTEAIRHCNVGFPPGLQDQLQGAGGTLNMHWWFTNHAVVLDTAGRLMFENVETAKTNEWREFLRLLRQARPTCPINGLLLVIPSESLLTDTADEIQRKGGKIAEQLDFVQRALGVRFPVFVVVTKCDKINGFRAFFESLSDPSLQGQMLGWSNPADLDEPFNPDRVEEHLRSVAERLRRRRMGLLLDPVHTDDPVGGRRIDQVDALYDFPDALLGIAPRLRRYLEMVFVAGEWSAKPLFLRGIYFTSSMQEGAELDADLAQALGVDVESLPEGKVWEKSSAYFLRDLFMNKVFRERGLVTSATNARKQQRRRRAIVTGAGIAAVLILMASTWFASRAFSSNIGDRAQFWQRVATHAKDIDRASILPKEGVAYRYYGDETVRLREGDSLTIATLPVASRRMAEDQPRISWLFRPVARFSGGNPFERQVQAHAALLELTVLGPAVQAARDRLATSTDGQGELGDDAIAAFHQLVRIEAGALGRRTESAAVRLAPIIRYGAQHVEDRERFDEEVEQLERVVEWTYEQSGVQWPSNRLIMPDARVTDSDPLVATAARLAAQVAGSPQGDGILLAHLSRLVEASREYRSAENTLLAVNFADVATIADFERERSAWNAAMRRLREAREAIDRSVAGLGEVADRTPNAQVIAAREEVDRLVRERIGAILDEIPENVADREEARARRLLRVRQELEGARDKIRRDVESVTATLAGDLESEATSLVRRPQGVDGARPYDQRARMYEVASAELERVDGAATVVTGASLPALLDEIVSSARSAVGSLQATRGAEDRAAEIAVSAFRASDRAVQAARRARAHHALDGAMIWLIERGSLEGLVATLAEGRARPRLSIPLANLSPDGLDPRYHPEAADELFRMADAIANRIGGSEDNVLDITRLRERSAEVERLVTSYVQSYVDAWDTKLREDTRPTAGGRGWEWFHERLRDELRNPRVVSEQLVELARAQRQALERIPAGYRTTRVSDAIERARTESERLGNTMYLDTVERVRGEWVALGPNPDVAMDALMRLTPAQFEPRFLQPSLVYSETPGGQVPDYWSQLMLEALTTLASSGETIATSAVQGLLTRSRAFPLCVDESGDLNEQDLRRVIADARRLESAFARTAGAPGPMATLGEGASCAGLTRINEQLARLRGERSVGTGQREFLRTQLWPLVRFLAGDPADPQWPTWEIVTPPFGFNDEHRQAAGAFNAVEIVDARGNRLVRFQTAGQVPAGRRPSIYAEGGVTIRLYRFVEDTQPAVEVPVTSRWPILRMVASAGGERFEEGQIAGAYKTTVEFEHEGRRYRLWLGVRFDRDLPRMRDWPSREHWDAAARAR